MIKISNNDTLSLDELENQIICGDVVDALKAIPDNSVSVIFTSPPYNTEIAYGNHKDDMPWQEYLAWLHRVWVECARVLRVGGRLAINIDATTNWDDDRDVEYTRPIYAELVNQMRQIEDMHFRTEIMWCKTNKDPETSQVVGRATAWGSYLSCSNPVVMRAHEYILVWSKKQWNLEGDSEQSDMSEEEFAKATRSIWCIKPETRKMGKHPVPFPEGLVYRLLKLFSYRNDLVLDPFAGSGTTCKVAADINRRYIGIDIDEEYCRYAEVRASRALAEARQTNEMMPYIPRSKREKVVSNKQKKKNLKNIEKDVDVLKDL